MRSVSSHEGTCRCNTFLGHVPQHFHVCANVDFIPATGPCNLSPQCALHTFLSLQHDPSCLATWSISKICGRLFTTLFNFWHVFIRSLNTRVELRENWTPAKYGRLNGVEQGVCKTLYSSFGLPCNSRFACVEKKWACALIQTHYKDRFNCH